MNKLREKLLKETREVLADLRQTAERSNVDPADHAALAESIRQLDNLFLLVVAGEFNSGKSAFINALIGQQIQEEGVTPTTDKIHILQYGDDVEHEPGPQGTLLQSAPAELLRNTCIVDTPGTNAILREHEILTTEFIPRSDLVIFITSADRPFTESERAFLELIRSWGKKIVLVVNKIDILTDAEVEKVVEFVAGAANRLTGESLSIFAVSSKNAMAAKSTEPETAADHKFEQLEQHILNTLDDVGRFRLKLLNPLGVGHKLVAQQLAICRSDLDTLADDVKVLDDIDNQMKVYCEDMMRSFKARLGEVENILYDMERRGNTFFNETIRLGRMTDLFNQNKIRIGFEHQVVADTPQKLEARVSELIDWIIEQDLRQWSSVADHLKKHQQRHENRIVGQTAPQEGTLAYDRQRLIESIGLATQQAVSSYDKQTESARMAEAVQQAVIQTGLVGLGGVGLGVAVAILFHTAWADVTGILTGMAVLTFGLFILPSRRKSARQRLAAKLAELRDQLLTGLTEQFDREMRRTIRRIEDTISPYSRFIRSEKEGIANRQSTYASLENRIESLQTRLEELTL